jgi:ubiquitin-protein ligase
MVDVDGIHHFVQIVYPRDFPARPPWIRETQALTDVAVNDSDTFHQLRDGSLCLFALGTGPDAWAPELTVRDVVDRYREFRRVANEGGHVDEHGAPLDRLSWFGFSGHPARRLSS